MSAVNLAQSYTGKIQEYAYGFICQPEGSNLIPGWVISFIIGFAFAPLTWGVWWLLIYIIAWWIIDYIISLRRKNCWNFLGRAGVFFASILGFIFGRTVYRGNKYPNNMLPRGKLPFRKKEKEERDC